MKREDFFKKLEERSSKPLTDDDKKIAGLIFDAVREMTGDNKPMSKEDLDTQIRESIKKIDGAMITDEVKDQIREALETVKKIESMNVRQQIEERFNLRKKLEDNKDAILKAISENREIGIDFQARAAAIHKTNNVATSVNVTNTFSDNTVIDPEIALIRYPDNFILNIIRNRQVSKVPSMRILKEQTHKEGEAEVVAEGGLKPLMSYKFADKSYTRIKVAAHMEFTDEFQMDFEMLYNAILDLFEMDVMRDWQDKLLDKLLTTAPAYVATGLDGKITDPDMYAVVRAAILSVAQLGFAPDIIWMNPNDLAEMELAQDANGNYKIPPFSVGDRNIRGLTVYESTKLDAGKFLVGDSSTWREEHTGFILRLGRINEQFIHNEHSVVGEVFSMMYQRDKDKGSWVYGDVAAIKGVLQKKTEPAA